jgi:hypothetical protein
MKLFFKLFSLSTYFLLIIVLTSCAFLTQKSTRNYVKCDVRLVEGLDNPIEIVLQSEKKLATSDGRLLFIFKPSSKPDTPIPFIDNIRQDDWLKTFLRKWVPLCGHPNAGENVTGKLGRFDRSDPNGLEKGASRNYNQVTYNGWPLYYYRESSEDDEKAQIPDLWELVTVDIGIRITGQDNGGKTYNTGP